jgi:hypothetical protein
MPTATVMRLVLPTVTRAPTPASASTVPPTAVATATQVAALMAEFPATAQPSRVAVLAAHDEVPTPSPWNWPLTFTILAAATIAAAIWLLIARSGPVMW